MDSSLREYLRISPYQLSHILKYEPAALLSEAHIKSSLQVHAHKTKFSPFTPSSQQQLQHQHQPPTSYIGQPCYFCKIVGTADSPCSSCGECRKVICRNCAYSCGKCEKTLCLLDKTYDYAMEVICCFNC